MAEESKTVKLDHLILRNDTKSNWTTKNPVLVKGELGIETDTRKFKFGDGTNKWGDLEYAVCGNIVLGTTAPTTTDLAYDVGTIWADTTNKKVYMLFAATSTQASWVGIPTVDGNVATATKLATARNITLKGAVVENKQSFDGSEDVTYTLVLADSGATAGTYTKLTVNAKGIVTSATTLAESDIPTITLSKISDAGTAAAKDVGTGSGNVPVLNANGQLDTKVIPSLALTDVYTVSSESAMLALSAQQGDIAVRSDVSQTYILTNNSPSTLSSWVVLKTPDCKVLSVNSKTGAVTLTTSDISEGTNLYFTETRATSNFNTNIAKTSVRSLSDGANVILDTDTITLDGGNA
jgi:hypothetical protein